ncbi:MAG: cellulase family glycosylhydrolase [Melioribacteraceae bacterium]|nr:cellulase family glycosylhydrolase [Melioribacteraceae bacterium]
MFKKDVTSTIKIFHMICIISLLTGTISLNAASGDTSIVDLYGKLTVAGNKIINEKGEPVVLRGMSFFWSQWIGKYYNYECVKWLRDDWKCTVVRAAMAVESGGYLTNPISEMNKVRDVIDACIGLGIYIIVDWHDHNAQEHLEQSKTFFKEIASLYGDTPNIIYEIYNEPVNVDWSDVIKPYSEAVISEIRSVDPDNIIIVGTPTWSQDVDIASQDPINSNNIAYSLHFYAATHKEFLRTKARTALGRGVALFVTEFGTCESNGSGYLDYDETETWINFLEDNKISWCNWSIADKEETASALKPGASADGDWTEDNLTESGKLLRSIIITSNESILTSALEYSREETKMSFMLEQNYPNPFNPSTVIDYKITEDGFVSITIYDSLGNEVRTLNQNHVHSGQHSAIWNGKDHNGRDVSSGVYLYVLGYKNKHIGKKMILVR